VLLAIYLAVGALAAVCKDESQTSTCAQCETVGTTEVCAECQTGGKVPIDGVCVDKNEATGKCKTASGGVINTEKACGQCGASYFLHKGGCYKKGQQPGQTICTDTSSTQGHCKVCTSGYFSNPAATDNTKESCIACGNTTDDTTNNNKGAQNCATCTVEGAGTTGKTAKCISIANPSRET
ncbi:Variant-specific surface protein, partial [Giardia duodenalis]